MAAHWSNKGIERKKHFVFFLWTTSAEGTKTRSPKHFRLLQSDDNWCLPTILCDPIYLSLYIILSINSKLMKRNKLNLNEKQIFAQETSAFPLTVKMLSAINSVISFRRAIVSRWFNIFRVNCLSHQKHNFANHELSFVPRQWLIRRRRRFVCIVVQSILISRRLIRARD